MDAIPPNYVSLGGRGKVASDAHRTSPAHPSAPLRTQQRPVRREARARANKGKHWLDTKKDRNSEALTRALIWSIWCQVSLVPDIL